MKIQTVTPNNAVNVFIFYELDSWLQDLTAQFTLEGYLFRAVNLQMLTLIKNFIQIW